jgi:hypothetical protein
MNNDAADAAYWHKKYIETSQKAQDYAAKVGAEMEILEELLQRQTARIVGLQEHIENFDGEDR